MNIVFGSRIRAVSLITAGVLAAAACPPGAQAAGRPSEPGSLVTYHRIAVVPRGAVAAELDRARIAPGAPALGAGQVRSGVVAYRVVYRTSGPSGTVVRASGLIAFPTRRQRRLSLVEYGHGTTAARDDVPSAFGLPRGLGIEGRWSSELFASAGFAVALPDYLGLGVSRMRPQY